MGEALAGAEAWEEALGLLEDACVGLEARLFLQLAQALAFA